MNELNQAAEELRRHIESLVISIQTTKEIKHAEFEAADALGRRIAVLLKGQEKLPRRILYDLDMAAGILENEAEQSQNPQEVLAMSRAFRLSFGLILCGETHDDRKPGVPRVR
jgi:hypothetical protein